MDKMMRCEDNDIHFDGTKLKKLTGSLERLNNEDKDFRKTHINKEITENDKRDKSPKEEMNYDCMSTTVRFVNEKYIEKSKVPPLFLISQSFS